MPFYIGAGTLVLGIVILSTAHGHLQQAERVQAAAVDGPGEPAEPGLELARLDASGTTA
ncbi:hypothetical protein [Sphaerisporangium album]|uniref:hypothetical protein n=1 Tax=Sphaerisporangium album TaxID=509200 RepID=UPI0015F07DD1|nr:hypothetical protein [Sphaerisporangium album]